MDLATSIGAGMTVAGAVIDLGVALLGREIEQMQTTVRVWIFLFGTAMLLAGLSFLINSPDIATAILWSVVLIAVEALAAATAVMVMRANAQPQSPPQKPAMPRRVSLLDLYATDHKQGATLTIQADMTVGEGEWLYRFHVFVICQFDTDAKYLSAYLPACSNETKIKMACFAIGQRVPQLIAQKKVKIGVRRIGGSTRTTNTDLPFTGRLNLYHEDFFSNELVAQIQTAFRKENVTVHFFNSDYASQRYESIRAGTSEAIPEYKLHDGTVRPVGEDEIPQAPKETQHFEVEAGGSLSFRTPRIPIDDPPKPKPLEVPESVAMPIAELSPVHPGEPPTMLEIYNGDFQGHGKAFEETNIGFEDGTKILVHSTIVYDFVGGSKFFAFYVPFIPNASLAFIALSSEALKIVERMEGGVIVQASYPGIHGMIRATDLMFSGVVYLYCHEHLSIPEHAALMERFKANGMTLRVRGGEYLGAKIVEWHRAKSK